MTKEEVGILLCIFLFVGVLVGTMIDRATADPVAVGSGVVIDKIYTPATHSTGTGMVFGGKSGARPVMTSTSTSEKWILLVQFDGTTFSDDCSPGIWGKYNKGDACEVVELNGSMFNYGRSVR